MSGGGTRRESFQTSTTSQQLAQLESLTQKPKSSTADDDEEYVAKKRSRRGERKIRGKVEAPLESEKQSISIGETTASSLPKDDASKKTSMKLREQSPTGETTEQSVTQKFSLTIPKRKKIGKAGQPFKVDANFMPLKIKNKDLIIYHYDVDITPEKSSRMTNTPKRLFRNAIRKMNEKHFSDRYPAFDSVKNLYVAAPPLNLKNNTVTDTVEVSHEEFSRKRYVNVTIKLVTTVSVRKIFDYMKNGNSFGIPQAALQAIDVALRSRPTSMSVIVGRSFFSRPRGDYDKNHDLGDGLELWDGIFQSCVLGWKTSYLNVDVAHKGFPRKINVVDYFKKFCNYDGDRHYGLSTTSFNKASEFLVGLKIEYQIDANKKMTFKLARLGEPPRKTRFVKDDKEITVSEYFAKTRRCTIKYTELPCLQTPSKGHIPPELCTIVGGQPFSKRLNDMQAAKMVKYAATPADQRRDRIYDFVHNIKFHHDRCLKEFGIRVEEKFAKINARMLPAPTLEYKTFTVIPRDGKWKLEKFYDGKVIDNWIVLNLNPRTNLPTVDRFVRTLVEAGQSVGVNVVDSRLREHARDSNLNNLTRKFDDLKYRYPDLKFVIVILPDNQPDMYGCVKRVAELGCGMITQCIKGKTLSRMTFLMAQNLLLKINTKLNGTNYKLAATDQQVLLERVMIVGADVTHPSSEQSSYPSIAAVAASCDPFAYRYMSEYRLQPARMEIIRDMETIIADMLRKFLERMKKAPNKIIVYRDGVSEGQFLEVLVSELRAIQLACKQFGGENYQPGITFIVVQKRHHTRFFPRDSRTGRGRNYNVPPGTVVDSDITHPTELDFYLISHNTVQGTARPTKYHLIYDDNNFDIDSLQLLTYNLCHMFVRCTRAVSYPAPTYYAHLIAFRCRAYMEKRKLSQGDMQNLNTERHCGLVSDNILKYSPMYFV